MSDPELPYSHSEIEGRTFYHGTKADVKPGGMASRRLFLQLHGAEVAMDYFSETVFAATWGADLAKGEGPGRIYVVEPTGPFMDDLNVSG